MDEVVIDINKETKDVVEDVFAPYIFLFSYFDNLLCNINQKLYMDVEDKTDSIAQKIGKLIWKKYYKEVYDVSNFVPSKDFIKEWIVDNNRIFNKYNRVKEVKEQETVFDLFCYMITREYRNSI